MLFPEMSPKGVLDVLLALYEEQEWYPAGGHLQVFADLDSQHRLVLTALDHNSLSPKHIEFSLRRLQDGSMVGEALIRFPINRFDRDSREKAMEIWNEARANAEGKPIRPTIPGLG